MKTIRRKLFALFFAFMVAVVLGGVTLNALFLEDYYIYKSRDLFDQTRSKISEAYALSKDPRDIMPLIDNIDRSEGINITIATPDMSARINSFPEKPGEQGARVPVEIDEFISAELGKLAHGPVMKVVVKPDEQMPKLVYVALLPNGELLIMKKSINGIRESVAIANQFYLFSGLFIVLVGGFLITIFSKQVTRPIVEMSHVTESIANLDFDQRVKLNTADELGSLGRSINRISETLSASLKELKEDVDRRKQLVRNLSHELKTPIGVIKGYSEGLKFGVVEGPEDTKRYCSVISDECDRMDKMVRELLSLSMLESGMFEVSVTQFDLGQLLRRVVERFTPAIDMEEAQFEMDMQESILLEADQELIERAVNNYLTNALHHLEGDKKIKLTARNLGEYVQIAVFNTGKAIPESQLQNIWDVFYKVDQARTRSYGGHGLGLSIVRLIAELHGGKANVINVKDGVLFTLELSTALHRNFTQIR